MAGARTSARLAAARRAPARTQGGAGGRPGTRRARAALPEYARDVPLAAYATMGVGGKANELAHVSTKAQLVEALKHAREAGVPCVVVGKGSNVLFDDRGYGGLVVVNQVDFVEPCEDDGSGTSWRVGAGTPANWLAMKLSREGHAGLEFAVGIPGTVGGLAFMNAGAHGSDASEVLTSITCVDADGETRVFARGDDGRWPAGWWGYRRSPVMDAAKGLAIAEVTIRLSRPAPSPPSDGGESPEARARRWLQERQASQPVNTRSAGCIFRNPAPGVPAGRLIDDAGLKGTAVGGCVVSETHANYLVNASGTARSSDVLGAIAAVRRAVAASSGHRLVSEVRYLPYDADGFACM